MISSPRVELYRAPFRVNCDRARELLERARIAFEEIDFDELAELARDGRLREWTRVEWTATSSADW